MADRGSDAEGNGGQRPGQARAGQDRTRDERQQGKWPSVSSASFALSIVVGLALRLISSIQCFIHHCLVSLSAFLICSFVADRYWFIGLD
jgi:hypothetical protein